MANCFVPPALALDRLGFFEGESARLFNSPDGWPGYLVSLDGRCGHVLHSFGKLKSCVHMLIRQVCGYVRHRVFRGARACQWLPRGHSTRSKVVFKGRCGEIHLSRSLNRLCSIALHS